MIIYWHKRDMRLMDNQALLFALTLAKQNNESFVPIMGLEIDLILDEVTSYEFSEFVQYGLISSILPLYNNYKHFGVEPIMFYEPIIDVITKLHNLEPVTHLITHQEHGTEGTYVRDKKVKQFCNLHIINWHDLQPSTIKRKLVSRDLRDSITKEYLEAKIVPLPSFTTNKNLQYESFITKQNTKTLSQLESLKNTIGNKYDLPETSEKSGLATLKDFTLNRARRYRGGISSPNTAIIFGSRLSQYFAYGSLSVRYVYQYFWNQIKLTDDKWLKAGMLGAMKRLYWREHFIQRLETDPKMPDRSINPEFNTIAYTHDPTVFKAFCDGATGEVLIDACIRCLKQTGFINFRMRAMLISYAVFGLDLDWRIVGRYLATLFLDYEPGIHWSQVQMQAGITGINTIRVYSPHKQLLDQDKECIFVKKWIPELHGLSVEQIQSYPDNTLFDVTGGAYPNPVVNFKEASRIFKLKTFGVRKKASKEVAQKVYVKHGSRLKRVKKSATKKTK